MCLRSLSWIGWCQWKSLVEPSLSIPERAVCLVYILFIKARIWRHDKGVTRLNPKYAWPAVNLIVKPGYSLALHLMDLCSPSKSKGILISVNYSRRLTTHWEWRCCWCSWYILWMKGRWMCGSCRFSNSSISFSTIIMPSERWSSFILIVEIMSFAPFTSPSDMSRFLSM